MVIPDPFVGFLGNPQSHNEFGTISAQPIMDISQFSSEDLNQIRKNYTLSIGTLLGAMMLLNTKYAEKKEHKAGKKKNHAHKVEVEKKKGGYLVKTHQQPEEGQPQQAPEESVHPDMASVNAHMNDAMGPDEAQAPQGGAEPSAPAAQPIPGV